MLTLRDGVKLFYKIVDKGHSRWVIATHGIGEYLGRNSFLIDQLSDRYNIFQYDLRGHGMSQGKRATVGSIWDYVDDLEEIIRFVESLGARQYSLFGHSMGALITAALVQRGIERKPERVFLSSPPVGLPGVLGKIIKKVPTFFFEFLAKVPLSIPLKGMVDTKYLSHDQNVIEQYLADPNNLFALHSRLLLSLVATAKRVFSKPLYSEVPLFVCVGDCDGIINPSVLIDYFTNVEKEVHLKVCLGGYHELHNEIESYRQEYYNFLRSAFMH